MRKKDIQVGEEYAVFGTGRYDVRSARREGRAVRVKVVATGVEHTTRSWSHFCSTTNTQKNGVRVEVLAIGVEGAADADYWFRSYREAMENGATMVIPSREVRELWSTFETGVAGNVEETRKAKERKAAAKESLGRVQEILKNIHGVETELVTYPVPHLELGGEAADVLLAGLFRIYEDSSGPAEFDPALVEVLPG